MSVENQMVADFYARLWLWIDHSQPQCVMLDDGGRGGEATPDLCICFLGSKKPLRIEFKVVNKEGQIDPTPKQLETWGEGSKSAPHAWIAKLPLREGAEAEFVFWEHEDEGFRTKFLERAMKATTRRSVALPNKDRLTLPKVFARLLAFAERNGFLGEADAPAGPHR